MGFEGDDRKMDGAIVLIFLIGGIVLATYLTKLVNYYTFGHRMKEKEKNRNKTPALKKKKWRFLSLNLFFLLKKIFLTKYFILRILYEIYEGLPMPNLIFEFAEESIGMSIAKSVSQSVSHFKHF